MVTLSFTLIGCLLFAVYSGLIAWYHQAWMALPVFVPGAAQPRTKITVLIPARNEEENIGNCLQSLAAQTYPRHLFEVIVIDDHSTDGTAAVVREFTGSGFQAKDVVRGMPVGDTAAAPLGIRYLPLAEAPRDGAVTAHKKFAIETGVARATGELIVATDADCLFDPDWLSTLAAFYEEKGAMFIAAPVRIGGMSVWGRQSSLLSVFQTLDFITLQGITGAAVHSRIHSMCNGANLAYAKAAFLEVGGFKGIDSIPSGDDMLLMHKIFLRWPQQVFFLKNSRAIVSTRPESTWKAFFHQRIRWASKADSYDDKRIFWVLLLVYLVNALFLILAIAACWNSWWGFLLLVLLVAKTMVEYPFVSEVAAFFGQRKLMAWFPVLQPFHIGYTLVAGWLGKFGSYRWKDRKVVK
ncbi:glycosyltransferase [Puia dinghuensis]|uniref:Glycosyl transferase n=1 Tax=Puia dinghuensis TaxID=1792502 RepID=A0A8J2UFD3_9BACT|nr:glycosyltransferase [Puia dinghuensis]GGB10082.1 glycosyl transferase [Puia dinghuensis]